MKQIVLIVLLLLIISFSGSAQLTKDDNVKLDEFISKNVKIEADLIRSASLLHLTEVEFFSVIRTADYKGGSSNKYILMKYRGGMQELNSPLPLVSLIRDDYKLKKDVDAKHMQKALSLLFDNGMIGNQEIIQKENQWIFVQNDWFGDKTGFIVNISQKGKVLEIKQSEKLEL